MGRRFLIVAPVAALLAGVHAGRLPNLTRALVDRGYTDEQIRKMLGGNFLRVFRQVTGEATP